MIKPTSVQVTQRTLRTLKMVQEELGLSSYNDVIYELARQRLNIPESLFGMYLDLPAWDQTKEAHQD